MKMESCISTKRNPTPTGPCCSVIRPPLFNDSTSAGCRIDLRLNFKPRQYRAGFRIQACDGKVLETRMPIYNGQAVVVVKEAIS